ncbi:MAG: glycerophosphodiester phosphodiesterase [Rothia sp. (in: high G+C Gram-positive bacteria)]|uniref:glycerophosphodiester phosphodiesterase n=1 Tax=Rothia sp. (in: high G+C Gram-positive bacteria) TaxID=1885016 RepID=UPI0026DF2719|nr:glycerophosphodiester phosphodiesterase [Rothia sp. (in: high G+C Gram-positive bacteria)]MDO5749693.1 glycerophosphodiester phosphodiesterase [Rothia sp. (in: high G+C Gram-positive bacteria)]
MSTHTSLTRRRLISAGAAAGAMTGVNLLASPAAQAAENTAARTFISQDEFFIAHRGAGDVNPEHTAYAYAQAINQGARAVEISLRITKDKQLVCMHDANLKRTTGINKRVQDLALRDVQKYTVNMRTSLGENSPEPIIPTFEEALDAIDAANPNTVLFVEAKDWQAREPMYTIIQRRGIAHRVVIKMFRNGDGGFTPNSWPLRQAKSKGMLTWCYFNGEDSRANIKTMLSSQNVDLVGVPYYESVTGASSGTMPEQTVRTICQDAQAAGKAVIIWEIHRRSAYHKYKQLGARGFMCPDPRWVQALYGDGTLAFNGTRQHGMIPAEFSNASDMPQIKPGSIVHSQPHDQSVLLGPVVEYTQLKRYTLEFSMRWNSSLPTTNWQYGYIAFGRRHDGPMGIAGKFNSGTAGSDEYGGCYVLAIRPGNVAKDEHGKYVSGDLIQLMRYEPGPAYPIKTTVLTTLRPAKPFKAGQLINGKIIVRGDTIVVDVAGARSAVIHDSAHRGPYVHFGRYHGNAEGGPLELTRFIAREPWA